MPEVTIICDQNFLKNLSDIERVLQNHGGFSPDEAKEIAFHCAGDKPISVVVKNSEQAEKLAENLKKISDVNAVVEDYNDPCKVSRLRK